MKRIATIITAVPLAFLTIPASASDLQGLSRISVGETQWNSISSENQERIIDVFRQLGHLKPDSEIDFKSPQEWNEHTGPETGVESLDIVIAIYEQFLHSLYPHRCDGKYSSGRVIDGQRCVCNDEDGCQWKDVLE